MACGECDGCVHGEMCWGPFATVMLIPTDDGYQSLVLPADVNGKYCSAGCGKLRKRRPGRHLASTCGEMACLKKRSSDTTRERNAKDRPCTAGCGRQRKYAQKSGKYQKTCGYEECVHARRQAANAITQSKLVEMRARA